MNIVIDGNDGTGKSTLVNALKDKGFYVCDRGLPTYLTDHIDTPITEPSLEVKRGTIFLILDAPVEVSQSRLLSAGKDITEKYHTLDDLTYYRKKYHDVADVLRSRGYLCHLVDASLSSEEVLQKAMSIIGDLNA